MVPSHWEFVMTSVVNGRVGAAMTKPGPDEAHPVNSNP